MFNKLLVLLLTCLACSTYGTPLEQVPEYDMKEFFDSRIVGGVDAPPGYGKYMAALVYGERTTHLMCGGSIITKNHILTAAHCIEPLVVWGELLPSFRAVVGAKKWESSKNSIRFSKHVNHPGWDWDTIKHDIGVLFLRQDIKFNENVAIIPIEFGWVRGGAESFVTGWGRTGSMQDLPEKLQLLYVRTITPQECLDGIRKASEGWHRVPPHDPKVEICTFHSVGHGMCNGDSGSALVLKKNLKMAGIVSWGFPCAVGAPDMFVRVSSYRKWLIEIVGDVIIQ